MTATGLAVVDPVPPTLRPRLRVVDGEGETWARYLEAFDEHAPRLFRVAMLLVRGDRYAAEDAVADVFIATYGPWVDGTVDDLSSYLRRSLTNRVVSQSRHRVVVDRFVRRRHGDDRGDVELGQGATDNVALGRALDALAPRQRAAVVLRYYEGCSVAETAEILGVSEGTVKSQVSDALGRLRAQLGED